MVQTGGRVVAEFREVESGKRSTPQLAASLAACRTRRAVLVIAKLDRLVRNARFLLNVVEGSGDVGVVFCDFPSLPPAPVGKFMVTQMAAVAAADLHAVLAELRAAGILPEGASLRLSGSPGWVRSSAWIWLFSSTESTTAWAGGPT